MLGIMASCRLHILAFFKKKQNKNKKNNQNGGRHGEKNAFTEKENQQAF